MYGVSVGIRYFIMMGPGERFRVQLVGFWQQNAINENFGFFHKQGKAILSFFKRNRMYFRDIV